MLWVNSLVPLFWDAVNGQMFLFELGVFTSTSWLFLHHSLSSSPANPRPLSSLVEDRPNKFRVDIGHLILLPRLRKVAQICFRLWLIPKKHYSFVWRYIFSLTHHLFPFNQIQEHLVFVVVGLILVLFVCFGGVDVCLQSWRDPSMSLSLWRCYLRF